jgi:DNA-binding NarL/FixJ family response regulator
MTPTDPPSPAASPPTRILVVDDHPLLREGIVQLLNCQPGWVCCAQAGTTQEAQAMVDQHQPDLVLLDLRLGTGDGFELLADWSRRLPHLPVLVISQGEEEIYAERALRAGARGYLMKDQAADEVVLAVRSVLAGEIYASRRVGLRVLQRSLGPPAEAGGSGLDRLTTRELQVFQWLGAGLSTRCIADQLHLSYKTVETHRENIKRKLGLKDAAALIHCATAWMVAEVLPVDGKPVKR